MGIEVLRVGIVVFTVLTDVLLYFVSVGLDRAIAEAQI
jgi:hypothetical protein